MSDSIKALAKKFDAAVEHDLDMGAYNRATAVARVVEEMIPHLNDENAGCLFDALLASTGEHR